MAEKLIGTGTYKLKVDGVRADIIMNRPEILNAANCDWMDDLHLVLDEVEANKELRFVVFSGVGRAFSTGIDLLSLARGEIKTGWFDSWENAMRRIEQLEPVTIARLQGYVLGGGLQVALACDLRVAAEDSQHGLPAVLEALIPGLGTYRLPRFVGAGRAKRMVLTGELVPGPEALRIGLVDWLSSESDLDKTIESVIEILIKGSKTAQCYSKWLATAAFESTPLDIVETYLDYQTRTIESPEHLKAMQDYLKSKEK